MMLYKELQFGDAFTLRFKREESGDYICRLPEWLLDQAIAVAEQEFLSRGEDDADAA